MISFKWCSNMCINGIFIYFSWNCCGFSGFVMATFDSIHPPAGANPIIAILGGKGLSFVLMPVALGAIVIILFALFYNKLLGRDYP